MRKLLVASLFSAFALFAQGGQAAETGSLQAAYELFDSVDMKGTLDATMEKMMQLQLQQNPALLPYRGVMQSFLRKYLSYESLRDELAKIYSEEFSEGELHEITQFYKTQTGQKALKKIPLLTEKGAQLGMSRVQGHLPEFKAMIEAEAKRIQALQAKQP